MYTGTGNKRTIRVTSAEALTAAQGVVDRHEQFEQEYRALNLEFEQRMQTMVDERNATICKLMALISGSCGIEEDVTGAGSPWMLHLEFLEEHGIAFMKESDKRDPQAEAEALRMLPGTGKSIH